MRRRGRGAGLHHTIAQTLERHRSLAEVFVTLKGYLETKEGFVRPVIQIFRQAAAENISVIATASVTAWFKTLREVEPRLFVMEESSLDQFEFERTIRKSFSSPHLLYAYLKKLNSIELSPEAEQFLVSYEQAFPDRELGVTAPREWSKIYFHIRRAHPRSLLGIFSLPENEVYLDFFSTEGHTYGNHILYLVEVLKKAHGQNPAALILALKHILRTKSTLEESEFSDLTSARFIQWLRDGRLDRFEQNLHQLKLIRRELRAIQKVILYAPHPLTDQRMLNEAEAGLESSRMMIEKILSDLDLEMMDRSIKRSGLSSETIDQLNYTHELLRNIFGERYLPRIETLKLYVRQVRRGIK